MYYNDWTMQHLADQHQRELRRQAEAERLVRAASSRPDRLRWLIGLGQRLQAQHKVSVTLAALQIATERSGQTR